MSRDDLKLVPSRESKLLAERNIKNKIAVLEAWLRDGVPWKQAQNQMVRDDDGNRVHIFVPNSLRSFNTWSSEDFSATINESGSVGFTGNGNDTLNKYPHHKAHVINLLAALNQTMQSQKEQEGPNKVKKLQSEIERLNLFIKNQASKITELHRNNLNLSKEIFSIEKREKGNFDELRRNYYDLENQNNSFREQISVLTKQLKNIHLLKDFKSVK